MRVGRETEVRDGCQRTARSLWGQSLCQWEPVLKPSRRQWRQSLSEERHARLGWFILAGRVGSTRAVRSTAIVGCERAPGPTSVHPPTTKEEMSWLMARPTAIEGVAMEASLRRSISEADVSRRSEPVLDNI